MRNSIERAKVAVRGTVQGVGFRPFVYRLARELDLTGWVTNSPDGVSIEIEGSGGPVRQFVIRLEREKPPRAVIQSLEFSFVDAVGYDSFVIRPAENGGGGSAKLLPDIATCQHCQLEIFQPGNRRYRYPFTNCTNCGPRYTIIEALPYDRAKTSMKDFVMCPQCEREYNDPADRRFHAQPNACPRCGPKLELWDGGGNVLASQDDALQLAAEDIRAGKIVAIKGLGGFMLMADARNETVVRQLRKRKRRSEKPFALMYPSLEAVRKDCRISELEERLLVSPEAPIVILQSWSPPLAPSIAPGNPCLGAMLPFTPLHHLLLRNLGFPVVVTSGNFSDEPICTDENDALVRLAGLADFFLVHNRPIVRPVDDSVVRVMRGREMVLRRGRGYAPLPIHVRTPVSPILALGSDRNNALALGTGNQIVLSQHLGDVATSQSYTRFRKASEDLPRLYEVCPQAIACDLHPESLSTKYAGQLASKLNVPVRPVQHHWAHVISCMAENEVEFPALGVAWDGMAFGPDGTLWGGEFFLAAESTYERVAHLRPFRLPGGEAAVKQPSRSALGILFELDGEKSLEASHLACHRSFSESELLSARQQLRKGVHAPATSSAGRLFDAVASLVGLRQEASFEAQAALDLEFAIQPCITESYGFEIIGLAPSIIEWKTMLRGILDDLRGDVPVGVIAAKFHNTLVEIILGVAHHFGKTRVVLTGGCFQNRYLTEHSVQRLLEDGFRPYWHQRVPPNDGGLALGQLVEASRPVPEPRAPAQMASTGSLHQIVSSGPLSAILAEGASAGSARDSISATSRR